MCIGTPPTCGLKASDRLALGVWMIASYYVGARNRTPGPLWEQWVLLTVELALRPHDTYFDMLSRCSQSDLLVTICFNTSSTSQPAFSFCQSSLSPWCFPLSRAECLTISSLWCLLVTSQKPIGYCENGSPCCTPWVPPVWLWPCVVDNLHSVLKEDESLSTI